MKVKEVEKGVTCFGELEVGDFFMTTDTNDIYQKITEITCANHNQFNAILICDGPLDVFESEGYGQLETYVAHTPIIKIHITELSYYKE